MIDYEIDVDRSTGIKVVALNSYGMEIGKVHFYDNNDYDANVVGLVVHENYLGNGIGEALLAKVAEIATCGKLVLNVLPFDHKHKDLEELFSWYSKVGFKKVNPAHVHEMTVMTKALHETPPPTPSRPPFKLASGCPKAA